MKVNIWKIRNERGLSLDDLESLTGINRTRINRIEQENERYYPNILELEKIAKALDLKIIDLFESDYKM
ncbi:helix-turn-helix transcriptional regulator [Thomasclavelia sp.]